MIMKCKTCKDEGKTMDCSLCGQHQKCGSDICTDCIYICPECSKNGK